MTRAVARRGRDAHSWSRAGAAMTLVVLFLPCLLVASALVLDAGALLLARACLAAAADMGALAGVQGLDYERLAEGDIVIKEAEAAADAEAWVRDNLAGRAFLEAGSVVVAVEVLNPGVGSGGGTPARLPRVGTGSPRARSPAGSFANRRSASWFGPGPGFLSWSGSGRPR